MSDRTPLLRVVALLGVGALVVHQLRYAVGYGAAAPDALADQGHAYVGAGVAILAVLLVVVLTGSLATFARGLRREAPPTIRFLRVWARTSAALIALYTAQELVEGLVAPGHPAGLAGLVEQGGWTVLLLAPAIGALLTVAIRAEQETESPTFARAPRAGRRRPVTTALPSLPPLRTPNGVARHLAGRGPPSPTR